MEKKYALQVKKSKGSEFKQEENIRLRSTIETLSENIKMKDEKIEDLQMQKTKLEEKSNELREKVKENELLKEKIQLQEKLTLERELRELKEKYSKEKKALEEELNCLQEEKRMIEKKLVAVIEEKRKYYEQLMNLKEEYVLLEASYKEKEDIQSLLENQIQTLNDEKAKMEESLKQLEHLKHLQNSELEEKNLEKQRQELKKGISGNVVERGKLEEELIELQPKLDKLNSTDSEKRHVLFKKEKEQESLRLKIDLLEAKQEMLEEIQTKLKPIHDNPDDMLCQKCGETIAFYRNGCITMKGEVQENKEKVEKDIREVEKEVNEINREWSDVLSRKRSAKTTIDEQDRRISVQQEQVDRVEYQIELLNENQANLEKNLKRVGNFGQISTID
uniref:Uncharacterized protein n=1 Tax=Glossina palpalis gambiensis TaxID=67801 RepID=A0A1B0BWW8_9MUSC